MGPIAYSYDPKTFFYSGPVRAQECKIKIGQFYNPRFSTFKKPPEMVEGRSLKFSLEKDAWEYVAAPKPVKVVSRKAVEKAVEVRENPELLKQVVENERLILAIELRKKVDQESRRVLDLVMGLDVKVSALEGSLKLMRAMIEDVVARVDSAVLEAKASRGEVENLKPGLEQMIRQVGEFDIDRLNLKESVELIRARIDGEVVSEVGVEKLVSSVAPKKSWKFWS